MKNLQKIALLFILGIMFSINVHAKNTLEIYKNEIITPVSDCELDDATLKEWWKNFKKGFATGLEEETIKILKDEIEQLGGIIDDGDDDDGNDDDNDFSENELEYLRTFAVTQIQTEENLLQIISEIESLSTNDADYISKQEISSIFYNDPQMDDILKNILDPNGPYDDTFNFQTAMATNPGRGYKLGHAIGRLTARLLHKLIKE